MKISCHDRFRSPLITCGRGTGPSLRNVLSRTVRGVTPARNMPTQRHGHGRWDQRRLPANLAVFRLSLGEAGRNRCAVSVRLVGGSCRLILQGDLKTWVIGFKSKLQTALWLRLSHHGTAISACRSGITQKMTCQIK